MKRLFQVLAILVTAVALSACGKSEPSQPGTDGANKDASPNKDTGKPTAKKGTIGVCLVTLSNPFFKVIGDAITDEAGKHGYDVIVTSGDDDPVKQQNQIKDFIVRKVSAIAVSPKNAISIGPVIMEANKAGIPVFTFDTACSVAEAKVISHIATDNFGGGKLAARGMIEALGERGGKILIVDAPTFESCNKRVAGFKLVLKEHSESGAASQIEIVAELPADGDREKGLRVTQDALQAHGDLAGIFAVNDPSALGATAAIEKANKADQIVLIGFDGQPDGKQAIKDGKIYGDPIQFPDRIGRLTVQTMIKYFDGENVPAEQLIPTEFYKKEDAMKDESLK